jgi:hypothetical protein
LAAGPIAHLDAQPCSRTKRTHAERERTPMRTYPGHGGADGLRAPLRTRLRRPVVTGHDVRPLDTRLTAEQRDRLIPDLLRRPDLRLHKLPRWLHRALRRLPDSILGYQHHGMAWWLGSTPDWLDHWGYYLAPDGREVFVTEPYHVEGEAVAEMLELAHAVGATLRISPVSAWYPGWTIRVEFWPTDR